MSVSRDGEIAVCSHERSHAVGRSSDDGGATLLDVLAATIARDAARVAIDAPDARLSYDELAQRAADLADRLAGLGIGPGDRVGVRLQSGSARLYCAIVGVLAAGAAYVPVDADDPPARAEQVWRDADVCAVLCDPQSAAETPPSGDGPRIELRRPGIGAGRELTPDDDAWVIFTSGSSGRPKAVAVTHRSAAAFVAAEGRLWTVSNEDRVLAGLSVSFDASCEEMWLAWRNGAALVPAPRALVRAGAELGPWLAARDISVVSTVPTLAAIWEPGALAGVRLLILGGEALPAELGWRLAAQREVWNTYGPTEATVVTTAARVRPRAPITIGWPLEGWSVAVVDELGGPVALGEVGELVIGGVGLGRYLDPLLDAERYASSPALGWQRAYRTGDFVRETVDGLEFVGRRDDQVKIAGRRLELGEIEARLAAVPGVHAAAAAVQTTAAGNRVLVGYVTGTVDEQVVAERLAAELPSGIAPLVVALPELPTRSSGKVDRAALPWPPPCPSAAEDTRLSPTAAWVAERWREQLGPLPLSADSDFFALGGSSLAAAKLVSALRARFPTVAVADVYAHRRLGALAERLEGLVPEPTPLPAAEPTPLPAAEPAPLPRAEPAPLPAAEPTRARRRGALQLSGLLALLGIPATQGLIGVLAFNRLVGVGLGPRVGWDWIAAGWLLLFVAPVRALLLIGARRALLGRLRPGRCPRRGWLACRLWLVERLGEMGRLDGLAGTPWAARYGRISGTPIGPGSRLGTLPPLTGLVRIGAGVTLEADVDMHGWWIEADELVIGEVVIEDGVRVGTRAVLMPGVTVGAGAEIEPGSVVSRDVPPGERWAGVPARRVGTAGEGWPAAPAPAPRNRRLWRAMYGLSLASEAILPLITLVPSLLVVRAVVAANGGSLARAVLVLVAAAPGLALAYLLSYAVLVALMVRLTLRLAEPGWHADEGRVGWALWFAESLMGEARDLLFPLYSSLYTRSWLRLMGIAIGRRSEVSTAVSLNRFTRLGELSFVADDVVFSSARARDGWLHVAPISIGSRSFLGNGALLHAGTRLGDDSLAGVLTTPPIDSADGTSWFGWPALELPRIPDCVDASRTTHPSRRRVLARAAMDALRILVPTTISIALGALILLGLDTIGRRAGLAAMIAAALPALLVGALVAVAVTVAAKWLLIGRYRSGEHPLWSFFVWRDEIINSLQEQLAGAWLLDLALGTPLMSAYLRAMGSKVGRDVWCETLTITEFDLVELGDGCAINRRSCVETHLFHDRLMRIGPASIGAGTTLGPSSAVLPDTKLGDRCWLGARSVVLRGEELPAGSSWHGAPVVRV